MLFFFFRFYLVRNIEEDNKLQTFTLQTQLPAPNLEVAKRVADEAQRLIDLYRYYNFLNLVEFIKQNPKMDQMGAGFNRVMDRLCQMEHQQSTCCCEIKGLVRESENRLALQAERNHCEVMKGQQEIKCLIENTAKDQEIARLNRVVDAQRDQNIINSVVQALGNKTA